MWYDKPMNKTFWSILVVGVLALLVFGYFVFHLDGKPQTTEQAATTPSQTAKDQGLKIVDEKIGTGSAVKSGDTVVINYKGTLTNGKQFDSSYDRGTPFTTQIGVGQVIKGWDEGVVGMKVGGKRKLTIPPNLGYGDQDMPGIPANSTLIFDVELVAIQ